MNPSGQSLSIQKRYEELYRRGEMSLSKNYSDKFPLLEHLLREEVTGKSVLDFGCGPGRLTLMLARWAREVYGVDFAAAGIEMARHLAEITGLANAHFSVGDVGWVAAQEQTYDVIILAGVLEHLDDPIAILRVMSGVLNPHGLMVVQTPNFLNFRGDVYNTLLHLLGLPMSLTDVWQFTHWQFEAWAPELGLELEKVVGGHYQLGFLDRVLEDFQHRVPAAARDAGEGARWQFERFFEWLAQRVKDNQLLMDALVGWEVLKPVPPSPPLPVRRPGNTDGPMWTAIESYLTYDGWREPYYSDVPPFCYLGASAVYLLRKLTR